MRYFRYATESSNVLKETRYVRNTILETEYLNKSGKFEYHYLVGDNKTMKKKLEKIKHCSDPDILYSTVFSIFAQLEQRDYNESTQRDYELLEETASLFKNFLPENNHNLVTRLLKNLSEDFGHFEKTVDILTGTGDEVFEILFDYGCMYGKHGWNIDLYIISRLVEFEDKRSIQFMHKVLDCWSDYNDTNEDKVALKWVFNYLKEYLKEGVKEVLVEKFDEYHLMVQEELKLIKIA